MERKGCYKSFNSPKMKSLPASAFTKSKAAQCCSVKESSPLPSNIRTYTIGGVKVEFPFRAYPSQISMMDKIIRGCQRSQNCLLESPTGSGKTMALLCGAIAWQQAESEKQKEMMLKFDREEYEKVVTERKKNLKQQSEPVESKAPADNNKKTKFLLPYVSDSDEDDEDKGVFQKPPKKKHRLSESFKKENSEMSRSSEDECAWDITNNSTLTVDSTMMDDSTVHAEEENNKTFQPPKKYRVPRIYFCSRTHKQLNQAVCELKRTSYTNAKCSVLSSRNNTCIHPHAQNDPNKTEFCRNQLEPHTGIGCIFHDSVHSYSSHHQTQAHGLKTVFDLEELITFGRKKNTCPYFTARSLSIGANIIFCPYNYIIDPLIRKSMKINLKGEIVIFDEAHNIEDSCRDSASQSAEQDEINKAIKDCENCAKGERMQDAYLHLARFLSKLSTWMSAQSESITNFQEYNKGVITMPGYAAITSFEEHDIDKTSVYEAKDKLNEVLERSDENDMPKTDSEKSEKLEVDKENEESESVKNGKDDGLPLVISAKSKKVLEELTFVMGLLYHKDFTADYHVALTKTKVVSNKSPEKTANVWLMGRRAGKQESRWALAVNFWCMNPATVFTDIKNEARCIVLTSGTLSPIISFESELGTDFPIKLEANHVIEDAQCWVGSLGVGPNAVTLNGTYGQTSSYEFQDELGRLIELVCSLVPHGVLCFLPSYMLLDKIYERWSITGQLEKLGACKEVLWEPRRMDNLKGTMDRFDLAIKMSQRAKIEGLEGATGALLMAVFRGKISEGIDFSDDQARIIITVGVPFPNVKDSQVVLKKAYNDSQRSKGLLCGREWYQIQAFRALNQALGRCIRHRNDWGAILIVDNRFANASYIRDLSKWIRSKIRYHGNWQNMFENLTSFISYRLNLET